MRTSAVCALIAVAGFAGMAYANPPATFRITELFSNLDGIMAARVSRLVV